MYMTILHKEQKLQYRLTVIICIRPDVKVGVLQKNAINAFGYLTQERDSDGKVIFSSNETQKHVEMIKCKTTCDCDQKGFRNEKIFATPRIKLREAERLEDFATEYWELLHLIKKGGGKKSKSISHLSLKLHSFISISQWWTD